jgi:hypothetical protein
MAVTTWNIVPDYDEWGYDTWWSCEEWIMWHKELKKHFGENRAREIWEYAFKRASFGAGTDWCAETNGRFRTYLKENNLKTGVVAEGVIGDIIDIPVNIVDFASDAVSGTTDFFSGSTIKKILTITLVVGGIVGVAYVYKAFKKE